MKRVMPRAGAWRERCGAVRRQRARGRIERKNEHPAQSLVRRDHVLVGRVEPNGVYEMDDLARRARVGRLPRDNGRCGLQTPIRADREEREIAAAVIRDGEITPRAIERQMTGPGAP